MGNSTSAILSSYSFGEKVFSKSKYFKFEMHQITRVSDSQPLTLFTFDKSTNSSLNLKLMNNYLHSWKVIRHPLIPPLIDTYEIDNLIYIVTEALIPFSSAHLSVQEQHWSFYNLITFVDFLNIKSNMIHGNLVVDSFFLTTGKELKILGFEWLDTPIKGPIISFEKEFHQSLDISLTEPIFQIPYQIDFLMACEFILKNLQIHFQMNLYKLTPNDILLNDF
jgi:hypothetical protein